MKDEEKPSADSPERIAITFDGEGTHPGQLDFQFATKRLESLASALQIASGMETKKGATGLSIVGVDSNCTTFIFEASRALVAGIVAVSTAVDGEGRMMQKPSLPNEAIYGLREVIEETSQRGMTISLCVGDRLSPRRVLRLDRGTVLPEPIERVRMAYATTISGTIVGLYASTRNGKVTVEVRDGSDRFRVQLPSTLEAMAKKLLGKDVRLDIEAEYADSDGLPRRAIATDLRESSSESITDWMKSVVERMTDQSSMTPHSEFMKQIRGDA